jgi:DNA replication protein DnaC
LAACSTGADLGDVSINGLAYLRQNPKCEAMQVVDFSCSRGCGKMLRGPRFFAPLTACDDCRTKAEKDTQIEKAKLYWEAICPPAFRETKVDHPGFPAGQYAATRQWVGGESLFFYGPTGCGKTRLAMWLLKRALTKRNAHVRVLWPYELKAVKHERQVTEWVQKWGKYDVLLLDDPLQGASDARVTDALKDLIAYRQDWKRPNIVTSQIGGDDYKEQAAKFGKETKADKEVIEALLRRLRETCRVIGFQSLATVNSNRQETEEAF